MFDNKEYQKQYQKQYRKTHKEDVKKCTKRWYQNNKEHKKEQNEQYYETHKEKIREYNKQWCYNNIESMKQYKKKYLKTDKGKQVYKKLCSKHRKLGFIPLNEYFEDCEAHHISENFVVYIPYKIHKSIYHNIWTWQGMEQINKLAIKFL